MELGNQITFFQLNNMEDLVHLFEDLVTPGKNKVFPLVHCDYSENTINKEDAIDKSGNMVEIISFDDMVNDDMKDVNFEISNYTVYESIT